MGPNQFQQAMKARGFVMEANGRWHGPFGLVSPGTYNTIDTTSVADRARDEQIRFVDQMIEVKRRNFNAK